MPASESAQMRTSLFTKAEQERGRGTDGRGPKGQCSGSLALDEMKTQALQKHSDAEAAPLANPMLSCLQIQILHQSVHFVLKASGNGCEEALRLPRSLEWQAGQTCRLTAQLMACRSHRRDSRSERGTSAKRRGKSGAQTNDACKTKLSGPSLDLHSCNTGLLGCRLFVFRGAHAESCRLGRQSSCLMLDDPGRPCEQQSLPAAEAGA